MRILLMSPVVALALVTLTYAHEGHHTRIMGTVAAIHGTQLEVKDTGGKTSTIALDDKTRVRKGTASLKRDDLKAGDRVVVTAMTMKGSDGKPMLMAEEVRVGAAAAAAKGRK